MIAAVMKWLRWLAGFLEQHTPQSSARLVGILCGATGCAVAIICARNKNEQAATVAALIGGGAVGLLVRKKSNLP